LRVLLPDSIGVDDGKALEKKIKSHLAEKNEKLLLDFSETAMIYSAGLGLMMRLHKMVTEADGVVYLVNVSKKLRDLLLGLNLERVFRIYSTDAEFDISQDDIWKGKLQKTSTEFLFTAKAKDDIYHLELSGQMCSIYDLSSLSEFHPSERVRYYVCDLTKLEIVDTYGAQLFNDFLDRIQNGGGEVFLCGASEIIRNLFQVFVVIRSCEFFPTVQAAVESIQKE
jgi:anti-anti-sigma factor